MPKNHLNYPIVVRSSAVENSCCFSSKLEKLKEIIRDYADDFVLFQELFPSFVTTHLVSNPFSRRWQELPWVALPPPEKVVFNRHRLSTAAGARTTMVFKTTFKTNNLFIIVPLIFVTSSPSASLRTGLSQEILMVLDCARTDNWTVL